MILDPLLEPPAEEGSFHDAFVWDRDYRVADFQNILDDIFDVLVEMVRLSIVSSSKSRDLDRALAFEARKRRLNEAATVAASLSLVR